jgi:predicted RNase H-like nuclease (RuvC/YqgF family)
MQGRIAGLEREHESASRIAAQALEAGATRVTELAVTVAQLPPGSALHTAIDQLRWMEEEVPCAAQPLRLKHILSCFDSRLKSCEKSVDNKAAEQELRMQLESKAEVEDLDRLADALSQSCRDLTSTLRACRQDLATSEQNTHDLATSVTQCSQEIARLDRNCEQMQKLFEKREQDLLDIERLWSRRLWGYRESSPSSARHTPPCQAVMLVKLISMLRLHGSRGE